jgi:ATP-dependent RNA helicase RhlE
MRPQHPPRDPTETHGLPAPQPIASPAAGDGQPTVTFNALGLDERLLQGIRDLGYVRPTPIQVQAIPPVLAGRDVIGCAQTGTGKTAAFVLPILHRLLQRQGRGNVRALIIAPTRELALQSMEHLRGLSRYVPLTGAAIFGGVPIEPQIAALARGVDIISATPGRLLDHIYSGRIDFVDLQICVLDEADRMLDMGFLPDIQKILGLLPTKRQNLLYSATMPEPILALTRDILHDPVMVQIGQRSAPAIGVRHALYPVPRRLKTDLLVHLLRQKDMTSVLVFTRTKGGASRLAQMLERRGFKVSVLHGDRSQSQRLRALEQFRRGRSQVMVATDIAARGIDIKDISHVVNYDVPNTPEDYVHRIGRTARVDATGDAVTLMDEIEAPQVRDIERALSRTLPRLRLAGFSDQPGEGPAQHGVRHGGPHRGQTHGSHARPHSRGGASRRHGHHHGQRPRGPQHPPHRATQG